jgi:hypothetical protein
MNLTEAQAEFRARGFDYLTAGRMTIMLNSAKNAFEDAWEWPWLLYSTSGAAPLLIPDLKLVLSVKWVADGRELWGLDVRQIMEDGTDPNLPGLPKYWWLEDFDGQPNLHVWPVASGQVGVIYQRESPELASSTSEPLIPARYQPLWIDLAVVEAYKDSDNFTAASALLQTVNARLVDLVARYEVRNRQHSRLNSMRLPSEDD